ncbi:hypothetical protein CDL12_00599 [Handroanthus impetiginosus]|uniref:RING-type E3 ubiquitin transferase n=1 Tax=Handroanthus impetiginosus TaxID=429701 RepID=A0A2G9IA47_9LAMI|nr:hypothetical protein CDL12_00599 [Handroanthus impetiginosus]
MPVQQKGLDEATISGYPNFTYVQLKTHNTDAAMLGCSICLAEYKDTDLIRLLPDCGHFFHRNCVDRWLMLHPTCPVCRTSPLQIQ